MYLCSLELNPKNIHFLKYHMFSAYFLYDTGKFDGFWRMNAVM